MEVKAANLLSLPLLQTRQTSFFDEVYVLKSVKSAQSAVAFLGCGSAALWIPF
jgi:hypothetical protein